VRKLLPFLVATFAGILTLATFVLTRSQSDADARTMTSFEVTELTEQVAGIDERLTTLASQLTVIETANAGVTSDGEGVAIQVATLQSAVADNELAIERFEGLLLTDAERLITLPLLQRDLVTIRADIAATKAKVTDFSQLVAETNAQNRWVIGTLALGMLALVVPAMRSAFSSPSTKDGTKGDGA
jgi:hypothetical protein